MPPQTKLYCDSWPIAWIVPATEFNSFVVTRRITKRWPLLAWCQRKWWKNYPKSDIDRVMVFIAATGLKSILNPSPKKQLQPGFVFMIPLLARWHGLYREFGMQIDEIISLSFPHLMGQE